MFEKWILVVSQDYQQENHLPTQRLYYAGGPIKHLSAVDEQINLTTDLSKAWTTPSLNRAESTCRKMNRKCMNYGFVVRRGTEEAKR